MTDKASKYLISGKKPRGNYRAPSQTRLILEIKAYQRDSGITYDGRHSIKGNNVIRKGQAIQQAIRCRCLSLGANVPTSIIKHK